MVKDGGSCVFASGLLVASYRCKKGGIHAVLQGGGKGCWVNDEKDGSRLLVNRKGGEEKGGRGLQK